jgi:hypothetical protein
VSVGGGKDTKDPVAIPLVLYSVVGTWMSSASGDVGAYRKNANSDGVRATTVTAVTVLDEDVKPLVLPQS